jgi:hypothetical protein
MQISVAWTVSPPSALVSGSGRGFFVFGQLSAEKSGLVGSHNKNSENTRLAESIWPPRLTSLSNDHVPHLPGL